MISIKRAFCCVLLLVLTLTGCEKTTQVKPQAYSVSAFTLSYNEMKSTGRILIDESKNISLLVESPESLKGFSAKTDGQNFTVNYNGITATYTANDLPAGAFFKLAFYALEKIKNTENIQFEKTENGYVGIDKTELGEVKIELDEDNFIKAIKIPPQGFYLELSQVN